MINGNQLTVRIEGNRVANAKTVTLDISYSTREITSIDTNGWMEVIKDQRSFNLNFDGLGLEDLWRYEGRRITFILDSVGVSYFGRGLLTNVSYSGGVDDAATYSGTITSSGELLTQIPTILRDICHDGVSICFDAVTVCGPEIET